MSQCLVHYGIKGMRWGVRRSEAQLERARGKVGDNSRTNTKAKAKETFDKAFDRSIKVGKDKSPISPAERISKESEKIIDNSIKLNDRMREARYGKTTVRGVNQMSNDELKEAIERMRLEDAYADLDAKRVRRGLNKTGAILQTVGNVVAIGASAVTVAATIKELAK